MVKPKKYIPDKGDLVWLNFTPQTGHEQSGKRPAIVLSPKEYNEKAGLAIFCPITSKVKGYPFEVKVKGKVEGVILSDQVKSMDWNIREAKYIAKVEKSILKDVQDNVYMLLL